MAGNRGLDFIVSEYPSLPHVHHDHFPRRKSSLFDHVIRCNVKHADFGGKDDFTRFCDNVTRRPESVSVERGADFFSVGKCDGGRPVPWLHDCRMILVKGAFILADMILGAKSFGDHHHY